MLTTSHAILNTTLLGRKDRPERNWPLVLGALLPDVPALVYMTFKVAHCAMNHWVWDNSYYPPIWMPWVDWAHSIPIAAAGVLLALAVKYRPALFFSLSMLLHDIEDLFVHSTKSHHQFLPFSDYRFISPVSCHEPEYHAALMVPLEWMLVVGCCYFLWKRRPPLWLKGCLVLVCVAQGLGALYFVLVGQYH